MIKKININSELKTLRKTYMHGFSLSHKLSQQANGISNAVSINGTFYAIQQNLFIQQRLGAETLGYCSRILQGEIEIEKMTILML